MHTVILDEKDGWVTRTEVPFDYAPTVKGHRVFNGTSDDRYQLNRGFSPRLPNPHLASEHERYSSEMGDYMWNCGR